MDQHHSPPAPMNPRIRRLHRQDDLAVIENVLQAGADYLELERGLPPSPELVAEILDARPADRSPHDKLHLGLFDEAGEPLGFADLLRHYPAEGDWYLGIILLVPRVRGEGLGKAFLDRIVRMAQENGARRMIVCPIAGNERARATYTSLGFAPWREIPPQAIGRKVHAATQMVRELEELPHACPLCGVELRRNPRYPKYVCEDCSGDPRDREGRPLAMGNAHATGGFRARYRDSGEPYPGGGECWLQGVRCHAQEARFGGVVFQPWPEGESPPAAARWWAT